MNVPESKEIVFTHWLKPVELPQGNAEVLAVLEKINPQNSDGTDTKWYEYYGSQVNGEGKESYVHSAACYLACKMAEQELFQKIKELLSAQPVQGNAQCLWQLCPKCNGQGQVSKPPYIPGDVHEWSSSATTFVCDICIGTKIIATPTSYNTGKGEGKNPINQIV